jgi:hypothetical protein
MAECEGSVAGVQRNSQRNVAGSNKGMLCWPHGSEAISARAFEPRPHPGGGGRPARDWAENRVGLRRWALDPGTSRDRDQPSAGRCGDDRSGRRGALTTSSRRPGSAILATPSCPRPDWVPPSRDPSAKLAIAFPPSTMRVDPTAHLLKCCPSRDDAVVSQLG